MPGCPSALCDHVLHPLTMLHPLRCDTPLPGTSPCCTTRSGARRSSRSPTLTLTPNPSPCPNPNPYPTPSPTSNPNPNLSPYPHPHSHPTPTPNQVVNVATQGLLYLEWPYHFQLDFLWYASTSTSTSTLTLTLTTQTPRTCASSSSGARTSQWSRSMTSRSCPPSRARGGEGESVGGGGFVPQAVELEVVGPLEVEREAAGHRH